MNLQYTKADHIHCARVILSQARYWRTHRSGSFHFVLLEWAANSRMRACMGPAQGSLFG